MSMLETLYNLDGSFLRRCNQNLLPLRTGFRPLYSNYPEPRNVRRVLYQVCLESVGWLGGSLVSVVHGVLRACCLVGQWGGSPATAHRVHTCPTILCNIPSLELSNT
jgi:hypothetical protein